MARISDTQRRRLFGPPCTTANLVMVTTPWGLRVVCHQLVAARLLEACRTAASIARWAPRRIDSYACRQVRGSTSTSLHAFGLAWDFFDLPWPQPVDVWGPANAPDEDFRAVFRAAGFTAGADFRDRKDCPHIEWADAPPQAAPARVVPAVIPAPLVKPITYRRVGEATGMQISTHLTDIPALDNNGRGWADLPYPIERVVSVTGHGSSPPDDGYWPPITCTVQPRGAVTRVTLAGQPGQPCGIWWKIIEDG